MIDQVRRRTEDRRGVHVEVGMQSQESLDNAVDQVRRDYRLDQIEKQLERLDTIEAKLASIDIAANRWKGGFLVIVALGAFLGWIISIGKGIKGIFQ